jgi:hypothetical protein
VKANNNKNVSFLPPYSVPQSALQKKRVTYLISMTAFFLTDADATTMDTATATSEPLLMLRHR